MYVCVCVCVYEGENGERETDICRAVRPREASQRTSVVWMIPQNQPNTHITSLADSREQNTHNFGDETGYSVEVFRKLTGNLNTQ